MKRQLCIMLLAVTTFFTACVSTHITSSWKAENAKPKEYKKLLVIAIMDSNRTLRQTMEKDLAEELKAKGINAFSAFAEYGPKAFRRMNEEQANEHIKKKGYDGVITISLLNKKKEKYYVPSRVYYTPYWGYGYPYFWGYYSTMYDRVEEPGYYEEDTNYFWESNLYDLSKGKLIYSVQSSSFDPASAESLAREYGKLITRDMMKNGLIAQAK